MKAGTTGAVVRQLQQNLNRLGAKPPLVVDADFGPATRAAVVAFQQSRRLVATGEVGPRTAMAIRGELDPKALGMADLENAAAELGVPVSVVATLAQVESSGHGFDAAGRPVILFERHQFHRLVAEHDEQQAADWAARYPNLCNTQRGGYAGGAGEYQRMAQAKALDHDAALSACSWGLFQIMGYHWQALGYESLTAFVGDMQRSEGGQLAALVRFVKADATLHKALLGRKWAAVARLYNGPAYKDNLYDIKLARTHAHFAEVYGA